MEEYEKKFNEYFLLFWEELENHNKKYEYYDGININTVKQAFKLRDDIIDNFVEKLHEFDDVGTPEFQRNICRLSEILKGTKINISFLDVNGNKTSNYMGDEKILDIYKNVEKVNDLNRREIGENYKSVVDYFGKYDPDFLEMLLEYNCPIDAPQTSIDNKEIGNLRPSISLAKVTTLPAKWIIN
jgi:hypothetical protein